MHGIHSKRPLLALLASAALAASVAVAGAPAAPDLSGTWTLARAHSDLPTMGGGDRGSHTCEGGDATSGGEGSGGGAGRHGGWGGGRGGMGGGGGWGGGGMRGGRSRDAGNGSGGPRGAEGERQRPVRLPELMHVTQTSSIVSVEDSSGAVVEEIATVPAAADTLARAPGAFHTLGQWTGEHLVVTRPAMGGTTVTETVSLEDKGQSLVIQTDMQRNGQSRSIKRVYRRVTQG